MIGLTDFVGRAATRVASIVAIGLLTLSIGTAVAQAETRVLKFYNLHTKEKESIAYKKNGRYLPDGLKKANWFLRDWRKKQPTKMDTRLLDLIWEAYRQSGSRGYINVICGFRSPATNSMLRSRSSGVAKESQHTLGRALDFYLPDVPLKKMREIGLKMQAGGVGYYPRSGSPFVHFDIGNARHWPRMSRKELVAVFPKGNTIHVPSDGKPLPGYQQALASYKQRKGGSAIAVANAGASGGGGGGGGKTLLAAIFGGGADEEDDIADVEVAAKTPAPKPEREPKKAPERELKKAAEPSRAAPRPEAEVAVAALLPTQKPRLLATGVPLPIRDTFDTSAPIPTAGLPAAEAPVETEIAALDVSRIPIPRSAPGRAPSVTATPANQPDDVSILVAALEASPAAQEIAGDATPGLAYSVPMPRNRPAFDRVLSSGPATAASIDEVKRIVEAANSEPLPEVFAAAIMPSQRPSGTTASQATNLLLATANPTPSPRSAVASAREATPTGKTGRLARGKPAVKPGPSIDRKAQQAINARIEMAALVTDPAVRAAAAVTQKPKADRLVRDVPTSVFTAGFAPSPLDGTSGRFAGSAVNFLPVAKFD